MTNKKTTKKALLSSLLSLVLCLSMLIGTTFAWFTDSVTSANNIIKSGNLDIEMAWAKATETPDDTATWTDASTGAIFNYDKWEPGYVEAYHIKIENKGTLALKYQMVISPNGEVSELADVIDVYYVDPATKLDGRDALTEDMKLGTLRTVLANLGTTGAGTLLEKEKDVVTVALKMQESAGNEYQEKEIGTDFVIQLFATQYTYEEDSFDELYDEDAEILDSIFANGGHYTMEENAVGDYVVEEDAKVTLDMADNVMNGTLSNNGDITVEGGTIDVDKVGIQNNGNATFNNVDMNAGSPSDYSNILAADSVTTYNDVDIDSEGGGVGAVDGAQVVFNSGSITVNSASTSGRYIFYAVGEGTTVTINGGTFAFSKTLNQKRAYVYAGSGATVYIKGGTFGPASTRSGYTAGILGDGTVIITGGTFGFDPSNWLAEGYVAVQTGSTWTVSAK